MHSYRNRERSNRPISPLMRWLRNNVPLAIFLLVAAAGMLAIYLYFNPDPGDATAIVQAVQGESPFNVPLFGGAAADQTTQPTSSGPRIGLIAGHKDSDSGAVCPDGLTEAEINLDIAQRVAISLASRGIASDILAEFDPRLAVYQGDALISIHADSCAEINSSTSGFKIAASPFNDSNLLEQCILQQYYLTTGLAYHAHTITPHMTDYHVFRTIETRLPALIIEVGFMNLDRTLLTSDAHIPADGLVQGILCFLEKK